MGKVKYTEEQKRKLLQEVKEGRTIAEAARKNGIVLGTAYNLVGRSNNTWTERKKMGNKKNKQLGNGIELNDYE